MTDMKKQRTMMSRMMLVPTCANSNAVELNRNLPLPVQVALIGSS